MRLVMTLLCRDEADIVDCMIAYHLAEGVDHIIATDNGSVDGTREILCKWRDYGVLHLIDEPPGAYLQDKWVTRMARLAAKSYDADWVINADADEFFLCRSARLKEALSRLDDSTMAIAVKRHDFVPFDRAEVLPPPMEMPYRKAHSLNDLKGTPLPPKVIHRASPEVKVSMGNHGVSGKGFPASPEYADIELFHYPKRSLAQFQLKIRNGGKSMSLNTRMSSQQRWNVFYREELEGKLEERYLREMHFSRDDLSSQLAQGSLVEDDLLIKKLTRIRRDMEIEGLEAFEKKDIEVGTLAKLKRRLQQMFFKKSPRLKS